MRDPRDLSGVGRLALARLASALYPPARLQRIAREPAFRQEALAAIGLALAYTAMNVPVALKAAAAVLFLVLVAMEAVSAAVDEIVARISPDVSDLSCYAQDLGRLAVGCLLSANAVLLVYALVLHLQA